MKIKIGRAYIISSVQQSLYAINFKSKRAKTKKARTHTGKSLLTKNRAIKRIIVF